MGYWQLGKAPRQAGAGDRCPTDETGRCKTLRMVLSRLGSDAGSFSGQLGLRRRDSREDECIAWPFDTPVVPPPSHTSQVIQQALHRQPSTAAQYLQQMYAAQQQHLMLQTAALQQQHHLSSAQLQSLAAVQQVSDGATLVPRLVWKLDGSYMRESTSYLPASPVPLGVLTKPPGSRYCPHVSFSR